MDRGAWWATVHGVTKELDMTERLNTNSQLCPGLGEAASADGSDLRVVFPECSFKGPLSDTLCNCPEFFPSQQKSQSKIVLSV